MSMFQNSVLKSFSQDESKVALRWAEYQKFLTKVDYIKTVKEEKYQDGFLKDIFENCLGYTLDMTNPSNFNLEREKKNETDGKKADGVIYVDNKIVGVIELKAQDTKKLDKIEDQAFNYHNSHSNSKYVIISNFDELRFYINKKTAYEKFSLFNLSYEEFKKLHLLISYESIKDDIPLKIKEKTANFEQNISKELYKDFSIFRNHLFENIVKNNDLDKSILLRLTQKLCDRIIFILFAEDRGLLTANTIREIIQRHSQDGFGDRSMYDYYKLYFDAINEGNERLSIPKYNGGLFSKDEILDSLKIDDSFLDMEAQKLSDYDFDSEVSVNILGHIFEQSLTDLEEIQANIDNTDFDKTKSKRKKDGVFYTPEYITKYIVDNTLGKMCNEKRETLNLSNVTAPSNPKKLTKAELEIKTNLETFKEWLFNLKILDPACGSGAFLNQALEYLIKEHKQLQNDLALMGDLFSSYTVEESVLEHNLYGVDINEDAVEIAKLSLWLRTAQKGRPLTNLADKIKCGNSLISDKSVVENAFVWEEEFKEVFENGGFDIVIGNPPYVPAESINSIIKDYLPTKYISADGRINLYIIFYELGLKVLTKNGLLGFITPYTLLKNQYYGKLRKYILENFEITEIVDFSNIKIFEDATVDSIMLFIKNNSNYGEITYINKIKDFEYKSYELSLMNQKDFLSNEDFAFQLGNEVLEKLLNSSLKLKNIINFNQGIITGDNKELLKYVNDLDYVKIIRGADFNKYSLTFGDTYLDYTNPKIHRPRKKEIFETDKLLLRQTGSYPIVTIDNNYYYTLDTVHNGILINDKFTLKYIMSLLNSKLIKYVYQSMINEEGKTFAQVKIIYIDELPIKEINLEEQEPFVRKANFMLNLNQELIVAKQGFLNELRLEKLTTKLQNFETLELDEFIKEYSKAQKRKIADKLEERNFKNEWKAIFENDKEEVLSIQKEINETDKEIDQMVYKLYDLTEDEIKIVEGA